MHTLTVNLALLSHRYVCVEIPGRIFFSKEINALQEYTVKGMRTNYQLQKIYIDTHCHKNIAIGLEGNSSQAQWRRIV